VLFREPSTTDQLGDETAENPIFAQAKGGRSSGRLRAPVRPGAPALISAFRTIATPPLIVAVSLDENEVLTEYRHQVRASGLFFLALVATMAGTLFVLFRQMDEKRRAERALSDAQGVEAIRLARSTSGWPARSRASGAHDRKWKRRAVSRTNS
jgi:hypothetical protein